jgi:hypothetical protein
MSHRMIPYLVLLLPLGLANAMEQRDTAHVCLGPTSVTATTGSAETAAGAVREAFTSFLSGPSITTRALSARLQSQAREEARQSSCRYLLLTTLKHQQKHNSGLMRRMAGSAAQQGAWAVGASAGSVAGRVAAGAAYGAAGSAAYDFAVTVRNKDEMTLTSRLEDANGTVLLERTDKKKASADGEDLLAPLVEQVSEAVVAAVGKGGS